jgi:nucleotide-binding universal stress UspA family protein
MHGCPAVRSATASLSAEGGAMFSAILCASARITASDPAVVTAARLAAAHDATWSIIHVLESASLRNRQRVLHFRSGALQDASDTYRDEVRDRLHRTYRDLLAWAPPCELKIVTGFPWEQIAAQADRSGADLVVMGSHAGTGAREGAVRTLGRIGSTVEGVITREHAPVLIVNEHPCRPKPAFRRILVGIDFSASCTCALAFAGQLARLYDGELALFHMLPVPPYPKYTPSAYAADRAGALDKMASLAHEQLGRPARGYHVRGGALPHVEVLAQAATWGADAIVLGSHTKETHGKWYAGSTVVKVSSRAACPVFVLSDAGAGRASAHRAADNATPANQAGRLLQKGPP